MIQNDTCRRCRQQGHWAKDCPLNSDVVKTHNFPKIYCRCGHGLCRVEKVTSDRNFGKLYYTCPLQRGKKCRGFVQWCHDPINETYLYQPPYKFPMCPCGAGVCRKEKQNSAPNPNEPQYYFACPLQKEQGGCDFHIWEHRLLGSPSINVPHDKQRGSQRTLHDFWKSNNISPSKRAKTILSDPQRELLPSSSSTPPKYVVEIVDDDLDMNTMSWDVIEEDARSSLLSPRRLSTSSRIHLRQKEFQRDISAAVHTNASFAKIENSNSIQQYEEEKAKLENIKEEYVKTKASLEDCHQRCESLRDEAFGLKAMLHEVEEQLNICEQEKLEVETLLGEINTSMMEAEKTLKVIAAHENAGTSRSGKQMNI